MMPPPLNDGSPEWEEMLKLLGERFDNDPTNPEEASITEAREKRINELYQILNARRPKPPTLDKGYP